MDTGANCGNEQAVGAGIARTGVRRETVWVTSKFNKEDLNSTGFSRDKERDRVPSVNYWFSDGTLCPEVGMG